MTTDPTWTDSGQGDLLSLVASGPMSGHADREWETFVEALGLLGRGNLAARISPNALRPLLVDIKPQRVGAYTHRALSRGLVEYTGEWEISDDRTGRNSGKPCRVMRWIGGAL